MASREVIVLSAYIFRQTLNKSKFRLALGRKPNPISKWD